MALLINSSEMDRCEVLGLAPLSGGPSALRRIALRMLGLISAEGRALGEHSEGCDIKDQYLVDVARSIYSLRHEEEDEYGSAAVSDSAADTSMRLLAGARDLLGDRGVLPKPHLTVSPDGGVRMTWIWKKKQVRANIPGSEEGPFYLYFEQPLRRGIEENFSSATLAKRLEWLKS